MKMLNDTKLLNIRIPAEKVQFKLVLIGTNVYLIKLMSL
jgi:hypothetical protein